MSDSTTASLSVLDQFLVGVVRLAGARAGIVRARTTDSSESHLVASWGLSDEVYSHESSISGPCGICGDALRDKRIRMADQVLEGHRMATDTPDEYLCAATVAVPLDYRDCSVGVLALFYENAQSMPDEFTRLLHPAGQLLGLALENVRLEHLDPTTCVVGGRQAAGRDHDSLAQSLAFVQARMPLLEHAILHDERDRALSHCGNVKRELDEIAARDDLAAAPARSAKPAGRPSECRQGSVGQSLQKQLTPREHEILEHIALGSGNKEIAKALGISHETVKLHVRHIRAKLGFSTRLEAALFAINRCVVGRANQPRRTRTLPP